MSQYLVLRDGVQDGPYDLPTLQMAVESGQITLDHLIWQDGMDDWLPLRSFLLPETDSRAAAERILEQVEELHADAETAGYSPPPIKPPNTRPCPACGGTVSLAAYSCPHCGHPLRPAPAPKHEFSIGRVFGCLILLFLLGILFSVLRLLL